MRDVLKLQPGIQDRLNAVRAAEDELVSHVAHVQRMCPHRLVAQCDYQASSSGLFRALKPIRKCVHCLIEEEGNVGCSEGYWSTPEGKSLLGNSEDRIVTRKSRDEIYKMRIPGSAGRRALEQDGGANV